MILSDVLTAQSHPCVSSCPYKNTLFLQSPSQPPRWQLDTLASIRMASGTRSQRKRNREEKEEEQCRVCLEGEDDGPLVRPCACRGTSPWVHEHCLEHWRRTGPKEDAAYRCGQCMDEYRDALSLELLSARLQTERTDGEATISTLYTLAEELRVQGKYEEAELLVREVLEVLRATLGNRHPDTLGSINNLGLLLKDKGDLAAAEPLLREALEVQRETLGDRHPSTLGSINNLGLLLKDKDGLAAAEPLLREALEGMRETLGSRHPSTLIVTNNLAQCAAEPEGQGCSSDPSADLDL